MDVTAMNENQTPPDGEPALPVIQPGQRKPYVKATRQQIDERIGFVSRMLRAGKTKTQIHRAVRETFHVEWRQCDRYISWLMRPCALAPHKTEAKLERRMARPRPHFLG
jgi:hypothetical protein